MIYETEHLRVRHFLESDAADLFEYCSDPEVTKYLTFPTYQNISEAYMRIAYMRRRYDQDYKDGIDFAIEHKEGKKVIGSIGLHRYSEKRARSIEVGFALHSKFRNDIYIPEVLKGLFRYIKDNDIAWRIEAIHNLENHKYSAILSQAGMRFEGVMRKAWTCKSQKRADVALYSILVEEIE